MDLNLYGYQIGSQNYFVPPYVPSAVSCEAAWPKGVGDTTNPGEPETIEFQNPTASSYYNIFFAVSKIAGLETTSRSRSSNSNKPLGGAQDRPGFALPAYLPHRLSEPIPLFHRG